MSFIQFDKINFEYESAEQPALQSVSISINENEWIAVLGRNGSGKSTFGRLINGLLTPTSGTVKVSGLSTSSEKNVWSIRQCVGMIFQNPDHQFVATTVKDDLAFGLENLGLPRDVMEERIEEYSKLIGISHLLDSEPHRLSGGQKQRVAIAGVMAMEPKVIVFDEATSMLDPIGRKEVLETMQMLHRRGMTIISISHDMNETVFADRMLIFHQGKLLKDATPVEIYENPNLLVEMGLTLPYVFQLQNELNVNGVAISKVCLTEEELISELWKLYLVK